MIRPHGKITKNPDGTFTITTNSGYQFNINALTYSNNFNLDNLMQLADLIGQLLEQITLNASTGAISVKKVVQK